MRGFYIANVNIFNGRAHSIQVLKTVEALNVSGLETVLVVPNFRSKKELSDLFENYNIKHPFKIKFYFSGFSKQVTRVQILLFNLQMFMFVIKKSFEKNELFLYTRSIHLLVPMLLARMLRIPVFFEAHRVYESGLKKFSSTYLAKSSCGVVTITESVRDFYATLNKRVVKITCGFDSTLFTSIKSADIEASKLTLGYAGSLSKGSGIETVLQAVRETEDVDFLIVGGSDEDIGSLRETSDPERGISFAGKVSYVKVPELLREANVLVISQERTDPGSVSSKMYEYFGLGKAIVASDTPENRLSMEEGVNALFYPVGDKQKLAECISRLNNDRDLVNTIGYNNRTISPQYSFASRGIKIANFLEDKI